MSAERIKAQGEEAALVQLIVFNLGDEEFAVGIGDIREIIRTGVITPIPDSPPFVRGVSNIRGEIAAVIDLKVRFSLRNKKKTQSQHVAIREQEANLFGLMVDEVTEILRVPKDEIKKAPELISKVHGDYVTGVVTRDDRLIVLLDMAKVLSEEELAKLSEVQKKYGKAAEVDEELSREKATVEKANITGEKLGEALKSPEARGPKGTDESEPPAHRKSA